MDQIDKAIKDVFGQRRKDDPLAKLGGSFAHALPPSLKKATPHQGRIRPCPCPNCDYLLDAWTNAVGHGSPVPGDFTTCMNCLAPLVFTNKLKLRLMTPQERRRYLQHDAGGRLNKLIREDRRREQPEFELTPIDIWR